jgi:hypothetical protein
MEPIALRVERVPTGDLHRFGRARPGGIRDRGFDPRKAVEQFRRSVGKPPVANQVSQLTIECTATGRGRQSSVQGTAH